MRIGKSIIKIRPDDVQPDDRRWKTLINSLGASGSVALIETDYNKIIYLNPIASEMLGVSGPSHTYRFSAIFNDAPTFWKLRNSMSLTLHAKHTDRLIHFSLLKKLSGRRMLFELTVDKKSNAKQSELLKHSGFQRNEALISLLVESSPMVYYSYDPLNRDMVWYSQQIENFSGYKLENFASNPGFWVSRIHPNDYPNVKDKFDNFIPNQHISCEYRWIDAKDHTIWVLDQAVLVESSEDQTWHVVGSFMDITDRKEAEFAVLENERNYREIFNSSNDAIFIHDAKTGRIQDVNNTMLRMFRTTYKNALTKGLMHFSHRESPYDEEHAKQYIDRAFATGEAQQFTWLSHRDDQSAFWAEVTLKPIIIGSETKIMASVKNIDQEKRTEDQIKYQNDFEKLVLDISTRFINIPYDEVDHNIEVSIKKICNFTNTDAGYLFLFNEADNTSNLTYLWQRKFMNFSWSQLAHIKVESSVWYTDTIKSGQVIMIENLEDLPEENGILRSIIASQGVKSFADVPLLYQKKVIGTLGIAMGKPGRKWIPYEVALLKLIGQVFVNVMKRKESFLRLLESEEKYRHLIESQTDLIIKMNPEGQLLFVNPSYCEIFGLLEEDLLGKPYSSIVSKDDQLATVRMMNSLLSAPYNCYFEQRVQTKKGWCWIAWNNKSILNESKEVIEILGVGRDITYQKGVEEALRRSEDRFRSIVQHSSDIIFIVDKEGIILYDTPTVKRVLGYEEGSLVGTSGKDIIYPDDLEFVLEYLRNVMSKQDTTSSIELRMKHADKHPVFMEGFGINMIDHPSIQGFVITLRDISERKQVEKKILDTVIRTEEQERERFAKNLHDDLGPLLSSIKMYVNSLDSSNKRDKQDFIITQLNEVVKEAIQTTKDVSNDLSPHILLNYGLVSAIENFLRKVPSSILIKFTNSLPSERYSSTIENSYYRVLKELINNTLKHAEASQIEIGLEEQGDILHLHYTDNGKGFEMKNNNIIEGSGMGISNIISRARSLNGSYEFQTSPGKGFSFKMSIPMHQLLE